MQATLPSPLQPSEAPAPQQRLSSSETTWRYLGERDEADLTYCFRFSVQQAPEPIIVPGGAWAYSLPAVSA